MLHYVSAKLLLSQDWKGRFKNLEGVFVTAFSLRLLPYRFLFRPFSFTVRGTKSVTSQRIGKKYTLKNSF